MQNEKAVTGQGILTRVGPLTTIPGKTEMVGMEQISHVDRPLCTCVHCRTLGIRNQTTPEYRKAMSNFSGLRAHQ